MTKLNGIKLDMQELKVLCEARDIVNEMYKQLDLENIYQLKRAFDSIDCELHNFGRFITYVEE